MLPPTADHVVPFHFAMRSIGTLPDAVKLPPAYSVGPDPSSNASSVSTCAFKPAPSGDQLVPFHFATHEAGTPPAVVNVPPAYSAGPLPSSNAVSASTSA